MYLIIASHTYEKPHYTDFPRCRFCFKGKLEWEEVSDQEPIVAVGTCPRCTSIHRAVLQESD